MRTFFVWFFGIVAGAIIGAMIGGTFWPYSDGAFFGLIAGICTFACARLWLVPTSK